MVQNHVNEELYLNKEATLGEQFDAELIPDNIYVLVCSKQDFCL